MAKSWQNVLTQLRKRYSVQRLSALLGVHPQSIYNWSRGKREPLQVYRRAMEKLSDGEP